MNVKELFSHINVKRLLQYALYMFLALITQNMLLTQLRPLGVCPMVLPAAAVAVGMFEGASFGSVFSLLMGIFVDMAFKENTVMFTILFPTLSFAAGFVAQFFINRRFFAYMGAAILGFFVTAAVQMLATVALDEGLWSPVMFRTLLLQVLWSIPFAVPAYYPPAEWIE